MQMVIGGVGEKIKIAELQAMMEMHPAPRSITDITERARYSFAQYQKASAHLTQHDQYKYDILVARFAAQDYYEASIALYTILYRVFERLYTVDPDESWDAYTDRTAQGRFKLAISEIMPDVLTRKFFYTDNKLKAKPAFYALFGFFSSVALGLIEQARAMEILASEIDMGSGKVSDRVAMTGQALSTTVKTCVLSARENGGSAEQIAEAAIHAVDKILTTYQKASDHVIPRHGPGGYARQIKDATITRAKIVYTRNLPQDYCQASIKETTPPGPVVLKNRDGDLLKDATGQNIIVHKYRQYTLTVPLNENGDELPIAGISHALRIIEDVVEANRRTRING